MTAEQLIERLGLQPHPGEGGYFVETYRSAETIPSAGLPGRYGGDRAMGTAIYYLLTPNGFSALHRLKSDEIFHFYLGDPVIMLNLPPDGSGKLITMGQDIEARQRLQVVVPRGVWQGAALAPGGRFALLGTTVAPGFEYADFETPSASECDALVSAHPEFREMINILRGKT